MIKQYYDSSKKLKSILLDDNFTITGKIKLLTRSLVDELKIIKGEITLPDATDSELSLLFSNTDITLEEIDGYIEELSNNNQIKNAHRKMAKINGPRALDIPTRCVALYVLIRHYKPAKIVETGSYYGHSTTYILAGLTENKSGELHTFDAHPNDVGWYPDLHPDFELGYMIPDELRKKWVLHEGDINTTLEKGMRQIGSIDMFFHDSNHKESHKRFEFDLALEHLTPNGILASHDVGHGNESNGSPASYAFLDAADRVNSKLEASREFEPGDDGPRVFAFCRVINPS